MYGAPVGTIVLTGTGPGSLINGGYLISSVNNTTGQTIYPSTRIFHISLVSGGTGPSTISITNGLNGALYIQEQGTSGKGADFDFGVNGRAIPLGAYVTTDGNLVSAAIDCRQDQF